MDWHSTVNQALVYIVSVMGVALIGRLAKYASDFIDARLANVKMGAVRSLAVSAVRACMQSMSKPERVATAKQYVSDVLMQHFPWLEPHLLDPLIEEAVSRVKAEERTLTAVEAASSVPNSSAPALLVVSEAPAPSPPEARPSTVTPIRKT